MATSALSIHSRCPDICGAAAACSLDWFPPVCYCPGAAALSGTQTVAAHAATADEETQTRSRRRT